MRNILDIYKEYKIMPNLVEHQLRVASVAMQICDAVENEKGDSMEIDRDSILKACLLHDMGNIIKFKLGYFPEFLEPEGLTYWEQVQNEYIKKYGPDEHEASLAIARELGMGEDVIKNIDAVGFPNWCDTNEKGDWNNKICAYADTRVAPKNIVDLNGRLKDGAKRYEGTSPHLEGKRDSLYNCIHEIEKQIFLHLSIKPEDITEESVKFYIEKLKSFEM